MVGYGLITDRSVPLVHLVLTHPFTPEATPNLNLRMAFHSASYTNGPERTPSFTSPSTTQRFFAIQRFLIVPVPLAALQRFPTWRHDH